MKLNFLTNEDTEKLDKLLTISMPEGEMKFTEWAKEQGYTLHYDGQDSIEMIVEYGGL